MSWVCIRTAPRAERSVYGELLDLALEVFLPTRKITVPDKVRPGHSRQETVPQFPSYLFADVSPQDFYALPDTRGISQVVSTVSPSGEPQYLIVPQKAIDILKGLVHPSFTIGQTVQLRHPYRGLSAIIQSIAHLDSTGQVQVWLDLLSSRRTVSLHHSLIDVPSARSSPRYARSTARAHSLILTGSSPARV
jgi:transcription termination factor NusG